MQIPGPPPGFAESKPAGVGLRNLHVEYVSLANALHYKTYNAYIVM